MSALVERNFEQAWQVLGELVAVKNMALSYNIEFADEQETLQVRERIRPVVFSDTLVLYTEGHSLVELKGLLVAATELFHQALFRRIPIRAGIAIGQFRAEPSRSMYAGPALIEAYLVGERSQWLGITLGDSVRPIADQLALRTGSSQMIVPWDVPAKNSLTSQLVINWPAVFAHDFTVPHPVSVADFYSGFGQHFGPFDKLAVDVQRKYANTVRFINEHLAKHVA